MGSSMKYDSVSPTFGKTDRSTTMSTDPCGCGEGGALHSLSRPRFFAGQLLTEDEFKRLDKYIVEKNRLHNKHLHGWGVVSGLDVICVKCGDGVAVKKGYALSPHGDDIIIPSDVNVDICALINEQKKSARKGCGPSSGDTYKDVNNDCDEAPQEWVLAVCYSEKPLRGVTPLVSSRTTKQDCGCRGDKQRIRHQCEPTVIEEGYSFKVYPLPPKMRGVTDKGNQKTGAALFDRLKGCITDLKQLLSSRPMQGSQQELYNWFYNTKESLLDYLEDQDTYNCELSRKLNQIVAPSPNTNTTDFNPAFADAQYRLIMIVAEIMFSCVCKALQPPVICDAEDDCVPLAVVTVSRGNSCRVISVCNWTTLRKYVISAPNLEYWFSVLPIGKMLREALENFCCSMGLVKRFMPPPNDSHVKYPVNEKYPDQTAGYTAAPDGSVYPQGATGMRAAPKLEATPGLDPETASRLGQMAQKALETFADKKTAQNWSELLTGVFESKPDQAEDMISRAKNDNFAQYVILNQMVKPLLSKAGPLANIVRTLGDSAEPADKSGAEGTAPSTDSRKGLDEISSLKTELRELRKIVQLQQQTIDKMSR